MNALRICLCLALLVSACRSQAVWAYDLHTHRALASQAVDVSSLDLVLRSHLGFPEGLDTMLMQRPARQWVQEGAFLEDEPEARVRHHFHNPLALWNAAGLQLALVSGQSSLLWQQNLHQDSFVGAGNETWSWPVARQHFYNALAAPTKAQQDQAFAWTFRALGQVMHLIQDASVPAHVRNDPHLNKWGVGDVDWYEKWVEAGASRNTDVFQRLLDADPIGPSPQIFLPTAHPEAPVPIARLIDTDRFTGQNGEVLTGNRIGIAEYTNGNFLSKDTTFKDFALPRVTSLVPGQLIPEGRGWRRYFNKRGDGESIDFFVADGVLARSLNLRGSPSGNYVLDDRVHQAYAEKLIPRAMGYSAALLDYFFRGRLEIRVESGGFRIVNLTPNEVMDGWFALYYDATDGNRYQLAGWPLQLQPDVPSPVFQPPAYPPTKPPANAGKYLVVFRGALGLERDAVAATWVNLLPLRGVWHAYLLYLAAPDFYASVNLTYPSPSLDQEYFQEYFTRVTSNVPVSADFALLELIYRHPQDAPANVLTLTQYGGCGDDIPRNPDPYQRPALVDLVEFEPPADLQTLEALRYDTNPPTIRRVLQSLSVQGESTAELDISDVAFFGLRLRSYPSSEYPPPPPFPLPYLQNFCLAAARVTGIR